MYAEDGSLLAEYGEGSAATSGSAQYLWLPTANGPMPIAAVVNGQTYAVHSDHLNTPRKLTQANGQAVWQWAYSAFGDEQPTTAAKRFTSEMTVPTTGTTSIPEVTFNLRYPGQYFDKETGLHYNWHRSYSPAMGGRYTQADPIGLDGGWNRYGYAAENPLTHTDPRGQFAIPFPLLWPLIPIACYLSPGCRDLFSGPTYVKPPENAYDPNGPKAPGKPTEADGFKDPKGGENWVPNPNPGRGGSQWGWQDEKGDVWCPTGQGGRSHSGPHWDVQTPGGGYRNVKPQR